MNRSRAPVSLLQRLSTAFAVSLVLATTAAGSSAGSNVDVLIDKLSSGADFRVRLQAALELGKTKDIKARLPLENALDDNNAAVRAAAAAALRVLGDDRSIVALTKHQKDQSAAVRTQIESTINALKEAAANAKARKPQVLVQIGKIRNGTKVRTKSVEADMARASREKLQHLPGVAVLEEGSATKDKKLAFVMLTGNVKNLEQTRQGDAIVYSASVEFVLHKMPGQTIKGVLSGSAKAEGSAAQAADQEAMDDLRRMALEAAIESAIRRAPPALQAAVE